MNIKLTILNFLCRVFLPSHWIKINPYNRQLDLWLLKQIKEDTFEGFDYLTAYLGGKEVWTGSYPYGYGYIWGGRKYSCGSYVAIKLKRYLQKKEFE